MANPAAFRHLTKDDVRMFILDRSAADNPEENDLFFSDAEIDEAMVRAARAYNSISPRVHFVEPSKLPAHHDLFLHGTAAQLYLAKVAQLSRRDLDYDAGGVQVSPETKRLAHFTNLYKLHQEEFNGRATEHKTEINMLNAWGCVG
jgi:hypothetical protein